MKIKKARTQFFVNKQVQYDVIMHVLIFMVGLFVTQIMCTYLFVSRIEGILGVATFEEMSAVEFIQRYKSSFLVIQLIPVVLFLFVGFVYFGRMTLKIVGPLFNIQRTLRKLNDDGLEKLEVKLRDDDYFQELAQQINLLIRSSGK